MRKIVGGLLILVITALVVFYKIGNFLPAVPTVDLNKKPQDQVILSRYPNELNNQLQLPPGFDAGYFSKDLPGVRDLQISPEGILLASLTTEGRVVALPDSDHDGIANQVVTLAFDLEHPHGLAFYQNRLYIAQESAVIRYSWDAKNMLIQPEKTILRLPKGGRHYTRALVFDRRGNLYISIGSTCDTCIEDNPWHGSVIKTDSEGHSPEIWARGLRNSVFLTLSPKGEIWATEMGRDLLGDNIPPDEINRLEKGHFGWPFCYGQHTRDQSFQSGETFNCRTTVAPVYQIPAHSAPLGIQFVNSQQFPQSWQGQLLVAYHGSWNRTTPTGYKVVRIFQDAQGNYQEQDFLTGFLTNQIEAWGRPVDLEFGTKGELYLSDDKSGAIYIFTKRSD